MIDISIIVPVYCVEKYLRQSVQSMRNQIHKNIEIILVDDGSPDRSGEICDELAPRKTGFGWYISRMRRISSYLDSKRFGWTGMSVRLSEQKSIFPGWAVLLIAGRFGEHFETAGEGSALWNSLFRRSFRRITSGIRTSAMDRTRIFVSMLTVCHFQKLFFTRVYIILISGVRHPRPWLLNLADSWMSTRWAKGLKHWLKTPRIRMDT